MRQIVIIVIILITGFFYSSCLNSGTDGSEETAKTSGFKLIDLRKLDIEKISHSSSIELKLSGKTLKVRYDSSDPNPGLELTTLDEVWDLTGYLYVSFDVKNTGDEDILVTCRLNGEMVAKGGNLIPAGKKGTVKTFIPQNNGLPDYIREAFFGMRGWPGKIIIRPSQTFDVRKIHTLAIKFPNPTSDHSVKISNVRAEPGVKIFTREELADNFFPFVDEFGQYIHEEWDEKIHSVEQLAGAAEIEEKDLRMNPGISDWNKYGGWASGPQLKVTGSFRTEKYRGKWWFVDPEGKLFWSHGIVGVMLDDDTPITDREYYYASLPSRNEHPELYSDRVVGSGGSSLSRYRDQTVTLYYPLKYNLMRKYGELWKNKAVDISHRRLKSWGMNTMGAWTAEIMTQDQRTPYTKILSSGGRRIEGSSGPWGKFPDPFDKEFYSRLAERLAREKGRSADDPYCIGYFVDNELGWGDETYLAQSALRSPSDQPAKIAFMEYLKQKYKSIAELNNAWKTKHNSWEEFLAESQVPENINSDLVEFNHKITEQYFKACRDEIKKAVPDKLYLGARLDFHMYPYEDTTRNWIIKIAGEYCDVISFNRYRYTCAEVTPPEGIDKPVMIGEWHMGTLDRGMFHWGIRFALDSEQQAVFYKNYVLQALKNPYMVGTHWFKYSDQALTGRVDGENLRIGFIDVCDQPYQELVNASREMGYNMYRIRSE
jgi:hypothetical protein